jgi:hypothetical protein
MTCAHASILQTPSDSFAAIGTTAAPELVGESPLTAALGDGDDIRARELAAIEP